jgi:hypothetical protein
VSDQPRTVRLVLDSTAISSWVRESIAVGELLAEVNDEYGAVIVPLPCLVESAHATAMLNRPRLDLLLAHEATVLVGDDPAEWVALTELRTLTGRADCASAALIALDYQVDVMTRDSRWYSSVAGGQFALQFEDE